MCKSASEDIGLSIGFVFFGLEGIILSKKLKYWARVGLSILQVYVFDLSSPTRLLIHSIFLSQNLINSKNVETIGLKYVLRGFGVLGFWGLRGVILGS